MSADLLKAATQAMANAYAPYSDFPVGAAVRGSNGKIYAGCNIENASYPEGWCAETSALSHMVSDGERLATEILVIAEKKPRTTPCGGCRQRLSEFAGRDVFVHLCDGSGIVETITLGDLLPKSFDLESAT